MPVVQTWVVSCDNTQNCKKHPVFGKPNEPKNSVISRAFYEFGFRQVAVEDSVGYVDYYLLCPECATLKCYPTR